MDRVLSIEPMRTKKLQITLESGLQFCLYRTEIKQLSLEEGAELDREEYRQLCREILLPRCKKRIGYLLQARDISSFEIRQKIGSDYPAAVLEEAIDWFVQRGYIDDEEYAKLLIEQWSSRYGRRKIGEKLYRKGFPSELTQRLFEQTEQTDEKQLIRQYLQKKRINLPLTDRKEQERVIRRLLGQGFSWTEIRSVLEAWEE